MTLSHVERVHVYSERVSPVTLRTKQQVQRLFTGDDWSSRGCAVSGPGGNPTHYDLVESAGMPGLRPWTHVNPDDAVT